MQAYTTWLTEMKRALSQVEFDTPDALKRLQAAGLTTLTKLITFHSKKLASKTGITYKDALRIQDSLAAHYSAAAVSGAQLSPSASYIPSGINRLDFFLKGGFSPGELLEVCGPAGGGKSQLCLSATAGVALNGSRVIYVDTTGAFSAIRLQEIMKCRSYSETEISSALERIYYVRFHDMMTALRWVYSVDAQLQNLGESVKLIVIDCITSLVMPLLGESRMEGWQLLRDFCSGLKEIAYKRDLAVLITNNMSSDWTNKGKSRKPALGKPWAKIPHTRLTIMPQTDHKVEVRVIKSNKLKCDRNIWLTLSSAGLTSG